MNMFKTKTTDYTGGEAEICHEKNYYKKSKENDKYVINDINNKIRNLNKYQYTQCISFKDYFFYQYKCFSLLVKDNENKDLRQEKDVALSRYGRLFCPFRSLSFYVNL